MKTKEELSVYKLVQVDTGNYLYMSHSLEECTLELQAHMLRDIKLREQHDYDIVDVAKEIRESEFEPTIKIVREVFTEMLRGYYLGTDDKKPLGYYYTLEEGKLNKWTVCPNCGAGTLKDYQAYCADCSQALDWTVSRMKFVGTAKYYVYHYKCHSKDYIGTLQQCKAFIKKYRTHYGNDKLVIRKFK